MKQPMFVYEGKNYPISSALWDEDGRLSHISLDLEDGFTTIFNKYDYQEEVVKPGVSHADLSKYLQTT